MTFPESQSRGMAEYKYKSFCQVPVHPRPIFHIVQDLAEGRCTESIAQMEKCISSFLLHP